MNLKNLQKNAYLFILAVLACGLPLISFSLTDEEINSGYQKSYYHEALGNYTDAINALHPIFKEYPATYTVNLRLGYLYFMNQNYANAEAKYQSAQKAKPSALSPALGLLKISNTRGQYQKSEESGYKILQADMNNYYGNLYLAFALRQSKKFDAALGICLKMLNLYPEDTSFLLEYGLASYANGSKEHALSAFSYVNILSPDNITAKEMLALLTSERQNGLAK